PLDIVATLPDPGILQPVTPHPAVVGAVPDTFRAEPDDDFVGPRLGALSLAAILATAVAAMRGTHTVLSTWWENRIARQADTDKLREARLKHQLAMQGIGDKAAQQRAKTHSKVPSSAEFGRKALGSRSGGTGGKGGSKPSGTGSPGKGSAGKGPAGGGAGKKPGSPSSGKGPSAKTPAGASRPGAGRKQSSPGKRTGPAGAKPKQPGTASGKGDTRKTPSPSGGKQPKTTGSGMDRARARQERAGKRQAAALKRRAARQDARLDNKAKDRDAARDRKNAVKDARRAAKDKARTKAAEDKQAKKEQKQQPANTGRTGLGDALHNTKKKPKTKQRTGSAKGAGKGTPGPGAGGKTSTGKKQSQKTSPKKPSAPRQKTSSKQKRNHGWWQKARAYARRKSTPGGCFGGPQNSGSGQSTPGPGTSTSTGTGTNPPGGSTRSRRSPFENAGQATGPTTVTIEREDRTPPRRQAKEAAAIPNGPAALDPAPAPHTARPGTSRPRTPIPMAAATPRKEPNTMAAHPTIGGHSMSSEHATEISLDDALDEAAGFAEDAFKTHDECHRLADKAGKLRQACLELAEILATKHNLIGRLFQTALARFAESMDLVDRMAREMRSSSLQAAEMAEALSNDLDDAYRPYTQATADAGLTTPSAPIHNQS
ncbi:hypothetical protein PV382_42990, partial [Streptomyces scabiei]|uniref:hypothetical protein n=1 Tax=Streptomyces scabiei TaxID=1930 RepID=UPI0029A13D39